MREVRAPLDQYKSVDNATDKDRQRHLQAWLHYKLQDSYSQTTAKQVRWNYSICTVRYGDVKVCKLMFGALCGIKRVIIDNVQKK